MRKDRCEYGLCESVSGGGSHLRPGTGSAGQDEDDAGPGDGDSGGDRLYEPFARWAGAGATVPLLGFGNTLWKGVREGLSADGLLGVFKGGFTASAVGISGALIFGYLGSLIFRPKMK